MKYYSLTISGIKRELPIVSLSPKVKIASFNLLGDTQIVENIAQELLEKIKIFEFDYLVGPEVKVVPLLHELSRLLKKEKYIICRKQIHGYMVNPIISRVKPGLVLDGNDASLLNGKKVVVVDDVVSSGRTMKVLDNLMKLAQATIEAQELNNLIHLGELPLFTT